jgi:hypothetical protein
VSSAGARNWNGESCTVPPVGPILVNYELVILNALLDHIKAATNGGAGKGHAASLFIAKGSSQ